MRICISCEGVSQATEEEHCSHCGTRLLETTEVHYPMRRGEVDSANPLIGKLIGGKYRVHSVLGKGGMGTVFMAIHEVSLVPVALKILHPRFASRPEYRAWFLSEASKAGRVIHENSARIQDVSETPDGSIYIAMEYVDGVPLADWLVGGRSLAPATTLAIMEQMSRALEAAHESGVVHRDLTPRNVMVAMRNGDPFVKILDFGIAKGAHQTLPVVRTASDENAGNAPQGFASPPYSAPEYLEGKEVDARADLYSLGVIAYRCLSGRLPVAGESGAEMARATIAGKLEPLGPIPGMPARFQRLVESLIQMDPEQRPTSAAELIADLHDIKESRGRLLRIFSLVFLVAAMLIVAVAYTPGGPAYLRAVPGSILRLHSSPAVAAAAKRDLRTHDLEVWSLEYGGFDAYRLRVTLSQDGHQLESFDLQPEPGSGVLQLTSEDPAYERLLLQLARYSISGAVDLSFELPGGMALGSISLRIDDQAPMIDLQLLGGVGRALTGSSELQIECVEAEDLVEFSLNMRGPAFDHGGRRISVAVEGRRSLRVDDLIAGELAGVADHGELRVWVEGRDRAGNLGLSDALTFEHVDLRAPAVLLATRPGGGQRLTYDSSGARMEVHLGVSEDDLTVVVRQPDGEIKEYPVITGGDERVLEVMLTPAEVGDLYADGHYEIWVRDRFENVGTAHGVNLRFSSEDPNPRLKLPDSKLGLGRAAWIEADLVTNGLAMRLPFRCNPIYSAQGVTLTGSDGESIEVELEEDASGEIAVVIPGLADGRYQLTISMLDQRGVIPRDVTYSLRSIATAIRLSLPGSHRGRFLPDLIEDSLLLWNGENLGLGLAWRWQPDDPRLIRGRFWIGGEGALEPLSELPGVPGREGILSGFHPRTGLNRVALELRDVFGRPVEIFVDDVPAHSFNESPGRAILEFHHHPNPFSPSDRIVALEYQRSLRVVLESHLPFSRGDQVVLSLGEIRLDPERRSGSGGDLYLFHLGFEEVVRAAGISGLAEDQYPDGREFRLPISVTSPAGNQLIELRGRTVRSSLAGIHLEDVAENPEELDATLAQLSMVPVLSPGPDSSFSDPVPADIPGRSTFRPAPAIATRNIRDFYLSPSELTRAQYQAIVTSTLMLSPMQIVNWRRLVHSADPLGRERLTGAGMIPLIHSGDGAAWQRLLAEAPDRPVTGVNYFQAYCAARMAGLLVAGDPTLLRLPLGVEMEIAALGGARVGSTNLNGAASSSRHGTGLSGETFFSLTPELAVGAAWPLTQQECIAAGDLVTTELGAVLSGLDFGVREWVLDVPYMEELRAWFGDHSQMLRIATDLALDDPGFPVGSRGRASVFGVARGLATGERRGLIDGFTGLRLLPSDQRLPESVPGVVRILILRRDARGLTAGQFDPHLQLLGFRLAGYQRLIERVRRR